VESVGGSGCGGDISGKKNESIFNYLSLTPLSEIDIEGDYSSTSKIIERIVKRYGK